MSLDTLQDLLVDNIKDLYNAERQLLTALPKMAKKASSPALREALEAHHAETEQQVERLVEVFGLLDQPKRGKTCKGMQGLIEEGKEVLEEDGDDAVLDAGIIVAAQKVEHYEITRYGTLIAWARELGRPDCALVLEETLEEEKAADEKLTAIAEGEVNEQALEAAAVGEDEDE